MVVSRFWKCFKNWSPLYLKVMLIKMGPSNEDIWFLDIGILDLAVIVATLALGSRPRQRGCKGAGQEEARESH
jgi:hypothetical protein